MSTYSGIERSIARLLGRFPLLKKFAKYSYSRLVYFKEKKRFKYKAVVDPVVYNVGHGASFFGYYDKSPENSQGLVLGLVSTQSTKKPPAKNPKIDFVVFGSDRKKILNISLCAYNWQQGCRGHWLTDDLFIVNDFDCERRRYVARVYSVARQSEVKMFDRPVQDSFSTDYFISLNYQRLMTLRPDYGYRNLPILNENNLKDLSGDGLWRVDYETGKEKLIVSLADICKIDPLPEFKQAVHKFNHVMISPDGNHFIFMHRYFIGKRRFDRLFLACSSTANVCVLSDRGMVSHCFWVDTKTVIGYLRGPEDVDAYWLIDIETKEFSRLPDNALQGYGDGHPHVYGDWFVTDTYPDKSRMQHLLICNWRTGEVKKLGEFFHGFDFEGECRCDLHPRFSPDGKRVFFDSVFTGQRQLYSMDVLL